MSCLIVGLATPVFDALSIVRLDFSRIGGLFSIVRLRPVLPFAPFKSAAS